MPAHVLLDANTPLVSIVPHQNSKILGFRLYKNNPSPVTASTHPTCKKFQQSEAHADKVDWFPLWSSATQARAEQRSLACCCATSPALQFAKPQPPRRCSSLRPLVLLMVASAKTRSVTLLTTQPSPLGQGPCTIIAQLRTEHTSRPSGTLLSEHARSPSGSPWLDFWHACRQAGLHLAWHHAGGGSIAKQRQPATIWLGG